MPVPATLTSYLPVLLVSVTNHAVPDDTSFSTQPDGQVDYLSHEWREEDVWRSWRSMTRQKNAIANGTRLENASWRTWWKQRNKLKTISPETLNWLKDSDVTWLYGPLHIGSDWAKSVHHDPHPSPVHRPGSVDTSRSPRAATPPPGKKPILKRRSISQLLSLPASPFFHGEGSDSDDDNDISHIQDDDEPARPPLLHTKSDTHISSRVRAFRKESPPRILSPEFPLQPTDATGSTSGATSSTTSNSTGSSQDLSGASISCTEVAGVGAKKKHISFNTFVEQYIAIEKPKRKQSASIFYSDSVYGGGFSEGSEAETEEEDQNPSFYLSNRDAQQSDSDDDEEDEVLEIRSRRSRSSSSSRSERVPMMRTTSPPSAQTTRRPTLTRQGSVDREHMTIAPIAPTILKSTGVGNNLSSIGEDRVMRSQKEVELVYLPPSGSIYSLPGTPNIGTEDVYHHRESYFSVGTPSSAPATTSPLASRSADSSPILPTVGLPFANTRQTSLQGNLSGFFGQAPVFQSPMSHEELREDAYDYFGGPDLGEEFPRRSHVRATRRSTSERQDDPGGRDDVVHSRFFNVPSSAGHTPMSRSPRIIVNEVAGATEEREELSTGSSDSELPHELPMPRKPDTRIDDIPLAVSYIHNGPAVPVSVPRVATHMPTSPDSPPEATAFLSPSDAALVSSRGRSAGYSPTSGSTTTTASFSFSSDSRSESRGRSSTRNSSSDCERSRSRSSRGTNSPLGSISPTGSAVGIGIGVVGYGSYGSRDREGAGARASRRGSLGPVEEERGRERTGRRIADSLSPPSLVGSPSRGPRDEFSGYSPVMEKTVLPSSARSVSGSSVSGSSTASGATGATAKPEPEEEDRRGRSPVVPQQRVAPSFAIPSPIPEEEETRSRQPTPANSPVRALALHPPSPSPSSPAPTAGAHHPPAIQLHVTPPKSRPSAPVTSPSEAQATPSSPTTRNPPKQVRSPERAVVVVADEHQPPPGLVGRAAEIVAQARGFLGSIWNAV
ncbi:hypothetical protein BDW22DRAFT_1431493 [Trametopsis cervina]|nr:hypothetical protein BDW22DRAFT_1431493 [Trametopsis cervina]